MNQYLKLLEQESLYERSFRMMLFSGQNTYALPNSKIILIREKSPEGKEFIEDEAETIATRRRYGEHTFWVVEG